MAHPDQESLRIAEAAAAVSLATDLGMGFPFEHGFRATLMTTRLCEVLGVDDNIVRQAYYASMLMYSGCHSDAALGRPIIGGNRADTLVPNLFGGSLERMSGFLRTLPPADASTVERAIEIARRLPRLAANAGQQQRALCEVAEMLAQRLGLPTEIHGLFTFLTERWDGLSVLRRAKGDDIPLAVRIFVLARDIAFQRHIGGDEHAIRMARERGGRAFDPELAATLVSHADEVFAAADIQGPAWASVLEAEPKPWLVLESDDIDRALMAIGDFADLVSPTLSGHSRGLADLVGNAAMIVGMDDEEVRRLRRAAYVHDIGRVAVDPTIWDKDPPLALDDVEQIRLHPYHTERILSQSPILHALATVARDHHEHLDGSGFHRGVDAQSLQPSARLLAAADSFKSMTEHRPGRPARGPGDATRELARLADAGKLEPALVRAVIAAAGQPVPDMDRPAGLTERETEVLGLLARGFLTKQIATALGISPKTADTHIQSAYRKMGVSTRAAATLFAMEHRLVPSGELPIHG